MDAVLSPKNLKVKRYRMGTTQSASAAVGIAPIDDAFKNSLSFSGTSLPSGQPVTRHYIQACRSYGPVVAFSSRGQHGISQSRITKPPTGTAKPRHLQREPPSLSKEGCLVLRRHSTSSPLGSLLSCLPANSSSEGQQASSASSSERLSILHTSIGSSQSTFATSAEFASTCEQATLDMHTRYVRSGKKSGVYSGIYVYVPSSVQEEKVFVAHMKGLEAVDALRLPGVRVPRTAKVFFLGLTVACIELVSLHSVATFPSSVFASVAEEPLSSQASAHAKVVSIMISKALRLLSEPAILMFESGGGSLVVVDACGLLPALTLAPTPIKPWHAARYESILGYDFPKGVASGLQGGLIAPTQSKGRHEEFPMLHAVLNAALHYPKRKHTQLSNLHLLVVGKSLGSSHHCDDAFVCTTQPVTGGSCKSFGFQIPPSTDANKFLTAVAIKGMTGVLCDAFDAECGNPIDAKVISSTSNLGSFVDKRTIPQESFVTLMKKCGLGICMLGHLWVAFRSKSGDNGRALRCHVATEILARAVKRILHAKLASLLSPKSAKGADEVPVSHQTIIEVVMAVLRGVAEESFRDTQLLPLVQSMFFATVGGGDKGVLVPVVGKDVSLHLVLGRVEELVGVVMSEGALQSIRPFCRVAKTGEFPLQLSAAEELKLCTVASKREDGMAGASTVVAVSFHRGNCQRMWTVLEQLRGRARYPADGVLSDTASMMQMFVAMNEFTLLSHLLHSPTLPMFGGSSGHSTSVQNRNQWLMATVSDKRMDQYIQMSAGCEHDKMLVAHFLLLLADRLLRTPSTVSNGAQIIQQVLGLTLFQGMAHVHPVGSRFLQEQLHRVSIEACYATNQIKEAHAIAKRWLRAGCGALFGNTSEAYFEATRMLMVSLIRSKKKREATRIAQKQYDLAELVYGGKSSIHAVVLSAEQVMELHTDVVSRSKSIMGGSSRGSPSRHLVSTTAILRIASAANDLGSLTWRHAPICGLIHFRRAIAIYVAVYGADSAASATTTYNIGLALLRLNLFGSSQKHILVARRAAQGMGDDLGLVQLCDASLKSLSLISVVKIQRWYRSLRYGIAKSQTTRTDTTTTFQSALSWSDEHSEISPSNAAD